MEARRKTRIDRLTADREEMQETPDHTLTEEDLFMEGEREGAFSSPCHDGRPLSAASTTHAPLSPEARARGGVTPCLIRVSIGLESAKDLIADFDQALARAQSAPGVAST